MIDLREIYEAYFDDVYAYIRRLSGDASLAEEITAETFFRAVRGVDSFDGSCDIRVWLCQIAKNAYFSYLRKNKRLSSLEAVEEPADDIDLAKGLADAEDCQRIHRELHALNEPYKEVFTLRLFAQLSFRQIGALFGKTENWACVVYHRARKKIRDQLEDET